MVNTFITYRKKDGNDYLPDYKKSAESLDIMRLRKQCVEAYQILNILKSLDKISELENFPNFNIFNDSKSTNEIISKNFLDRVEWSKNIRKRYVELEYRYGCIEGSYIKFPKNNLPIRVYSKDRYEIIENDTYVILQSKLKHINYGECISENVYKIPRKKIILPSDELYTLGFSQHAIVKMWIGYEESLKMYINDHIDVYCSKYKKNGERCSIIIKKYKIDNNFIQHPWWIVYYNGVILSHRASLLRKFYLYYSENKDFVNIPLKYKKNGYVWTGSFSNTEYVKKILDGKKINIKDISAPINNSKSEFILGVDGYVKFFYKK